METILYLLGSPVFIWLVTISGLLGLYGVTVYAARRLEL